MVGDDALKQAIRKYRAEDDKDPKYVEQLIEAAAKRDLGWFFDDWVYQDRGLPDFHVQSVHPWKTETREDVQFITVTLENLGNAGAEVPFTVIFEAARSRNGLKCGQEARLRRELNCRAASEIMVNDGSVPESDVANNVFKVPARSRGVADIIWKSALSIAMTIFAVSPTRTRAIGCGECCQRLKLGERCRRNRLPGSRIGTASRR